VVEETMRGKPVTEEQIQAWADEAEKGYPAEQLRKRGRRPVGEGPGKMIAVRMDEALLAQLSARAERDHISRSEAIRAAVKAWIDAPSCGFTDQR
jgi:predicted HicB family RNase H-like nuclease